MSGTDVNFPGKFYTYYTSDESSYTSDERSSYTSDESSYTSDESSDSSDKNHSGTSSGLNLKPDLSEYGIHVIFAGEQHVTGPSSDENKPLINSITSSNNPLELEKLRNNESFKIKNPKVYKTLLITGVILVILGLIAVAVSFSVYYTVGWQHLLSQGITVKEGLYLIAAPAGGVVVLTTSAILIIKYLIKQRDLKKSEQNLERPKKEPQLNQKTQRKKSCLPPWISKKSYYS